MLHSKVDIFSSVQAARTMFTARISSDVSITTIGVEELIKTFRRSSVSVIIQTRALTTKGTKAHEGDRSTPFCVTSCPLWLMVLMRVNCLTLRELLPYNK